MAECKHTFNEVVDALATPALLETCPICMRETIDKLQEENAKLLALTKRGNPRKPEVTTLSPGLIGTPIDYEITTIYWM